MIHDYWILITIMRALGGKGAKLLAESPCSDPQLSNQMTNDFDVESTKPVSVLFKMIVMFSVKLVRTNL